MNTTCTPESKTDTATPWRFDLAKHPCYNAEGKHTHARIHLPVAPKCNIQCNYCNRKFDCVNESRPGCDEPGSAAGPSRGLPASEMKEKVPSIEVVGIAGPGDPFANPYETMETLRQVRAAYPDIMLCLASNGLHIGPYIDEIAALEVSHVTITINAVDPAIGALVYSWVRDGGRPLKGEEGATLMIERQLDAVKRLADHGILVKVNSIIIPGVNDRHIPEIASQGEGTRRDDHELHPAGSGRGHRIRASGGTGWHHDCPHPPAGRAKPQTNEPLRALPRRCRRADRRRPVARARRHAANITPTPNPPWTPPARTSPSPRSKACSSISTWAKPKRSWSSARSRARTNTKWSMSATCPTAAMATTAGNKWRAKLADCRAILVSAAGPRPKKVLENFGLPVLEMEGMIEEALESLYSGNEIPAGMRRRFTGCGDSCNGGGQGCS